MKRTLSEEEKKKGAISIDSVASSNLFVAIVLKII